MGPVVGSRPGSAPVSGIDPEQLRNLITAMERAASQVEEFVTAYKGRFAREGASTANITAMEGVARWARDEVRKLKRRHSLAEHARNQRVQFSGQTGMVTAGSRDRLGEFTDPEAARAAGERDAREALEAVADGDRDGDAVIDRLRERWNDPDYTEAFFATLGPEGTARISAWANRVGIDDSERASHIRIALGSALATASGRITMDAEWLGRFNPAGQPGQYEPTLLAPLLEHGVFDKSFLLAIGAEELATPDVDGERSRRVWHAVAINPRAAAEFYAGNVERIQSYAVGDGPITLPSDDGAPEEFADFIRTATIGARSTHTELAEANTRRLIAWHHAHPDAHTLPAVQRGYADVIAEYWDDLAYVRTAPVPQVGEVDNPHRRGIEMPVDAWSDFLEEAMRDAEGAGTILTRFESWEERQSATVVEMENKFKGKEPGYLRDFMSGYLRAYLDHHYRSVYRELTDDAARAQWLDSLPGNAATAIDWIANPSGITKEMLKRSVEQGVRDLVNFVQADSDTTQSSRAIEWVTSQDRWQDIAEDAYYQHIKGAASSRIQPIGNYDGEPGRYEREHGARFTTPDGTLLPLSEIRNDPRALQAYNSWLQDPALVNAMATRFHRNQSGAEAFHLDLQLKEGGS